MKYNKCTLCGKEMGIHKNQFEEEYWGCSGYPECKNTEPLGKYKETYK